MDLNWVERRHAGNRLCSLFSLTECLSSIWNGNTCDYATIYAQYRCCLRVPFWWFIVQKSDHRSFWFMIGIFGLYRAGWFIVCIGLFRRYSNWIWMLAQPCPYKYLAFLFYCTTNTLAISSYSSFVVEYSMPLDNSRTTDIISNLIILSFLK